MENYTKNRELENRIISFSVEAIDLCESLKNSFSGSHLGKQLIRSSSSSALNYGETQGAESPRDFIHKLSVVTKELRESLVNIKIINRSKKIKVDNKQIEYLEDECNQLVAIFVSSVKTAKRNLRKDDM